MKDNKHIQKFSEHQENLNKSGDKMTKKEILQWMIDAHTMIGDKNNNGEDEGKCLLGALIDILKAEGE